VDGHGPADLREVRAPSVVDDRGGSARGWRPVPQAAGQSVD